MYHYYILKSGLLVGEWICLCSFCIIPQTFVIFFSCTTKGNYFFAFNLLQKHCDSHEAGFQTGHPLTLLVIRGSTRPQAVLVVMILFALQTSLTHEITNVVVIMNLMCPTGADHSTREVQGEAQ